MFTGIVEIMGSVVSVQRRGGGAALHVRCPELAGDLKVGDSIAVNGACVTVTETDGSAFGCDLVPETVARTNLGILANDEGVNLERAVRAADRLGGHIVQGHVDAVGVVRTRRKVGTQEILEITIPFELSRYLAPQGSVTLDGVSLTVVSVDRDRFKVALIPHTVEATTLGRKAQQAPINVEVDVISKYVERHLDVRRQRASLGAFYEDMRDRASKPSAGAAPKPSNVASPEPSTAAAPKAPPTAKARPSKIRNPAPKARPSKIRKPAPKARRPATNKARRSAKSKARRPATPKARSRKPVKPAGRRR